MWARRATLLRQTREAGREAYARCRPTHGQDRDA